MLRREASRLLTRVLATALSAVLVAGCATQVLETASYKGYSVGQRLSAPVGGTFLTSQSGRIETVKRWVGVLNSPDGWQADTRASSDYLRKELIYGGLSGSVIEISYREFRGGLAAPAFFQTVKYDLSTSTTIVFQNFQISVSSATNQRIEGTLIRDN